MKNIITLIILAITLMPCRAQTLEPLAIKIERTDGATIKKAQLYKYTADAIWIKRMMKDSVTDQLDSISYTNIERISLIKVRNQLKNVLWGTLLGTLGGTTIGLYLYTQFGAGLNRKGSGPVWQFDSTAYIPIITGCAGTYGGTMAGTISLVFPPSYAIHGNEAKFKEFVQKYKK